jgi:N-acetylneuraminic acid mutarotase
MSDGCGAQVEAYAPNAGTWSLIASMKTIRADLAAVTGPDGRIYAIGGDTSRVEAYTRETDSWTLVASLKTTRTTFAAVAGPDGLIYAIGGRSGAVSILDSVEAYDPKTDTWATVASLSTPRAWHAAAVANGRIYVLGGITSTDGDVFLILPGDGDGHFFELSV